MIWITLECHFLSMPANCEKGREKGEKSLMHSGDRGKIDELTVAEKPVTNGFLTKKKAATAAAFLMARKSGRAIRRNDFRDFVGFRRQLQLAIGIFHQR